MRAPLKKLPPATDKVAIAVPAAPSFTLLVVYALSPAVCVNIPPPEPAPPGKLVSRLPSPSKKDADILILAVRSPTILSVEPSKVRFDSQVRVLASPPTLVIRELFVALDTRGTLITAAPSDVLKLPDSMFASTIVLAGRYSCAAISVPDIEL